MKLTKKRRSPAKSSKFGRRKLIILSITVLAAVVLTLAVLHRSSTNKTKNQTTASTKGEQPSQNSTTTTTSSDKSGPSSGPAPSGAAPKTPYGSFVSSHSVNLNDSELSTCLTSAGAKCSVTFTKDGVTKTLDQKTTDTDGAAYWTWKPQDLGLTAGSWQISATAQTNGKSATTIDGRNLVIQP